MESNVEYIKLFMEFESIDMPVVYFYEVDIDDDRFALRSIEVFSNRDVKLIYNLYRDVIEACHIPTVDELNEKVWGEGFFAITISKEEFDRIWNSRIYSGSLTAF
ncbi:MAG TPA: hypothetical protein VIR32_08085 [Lachnospiraceae bacterium]